MLTAVRRSTCTMPRSRSPSGTAVSWSTSCRAARPSTYARRQLTRVVRARSSPRCSRGARGPSRAGAGRGAHVFEQHVGGLARTLELRLGGRAAPRNIHLTPLGCVPAHPPSSEPAPRAHCAPRPSQNRTGRHPLPALAAFNSASRPEPAAQSPAATGRSGAPPAPPFCSFTAAPA
jgi:hypothetical protein